MAETKNFLRENGLLAAAGAALFLALSFMLYTCSPSQGHCEVDSPAYQRVAQVFAETGAVTEPDGTAPIHTQGYHFFLGLVYVLFGTELWKIILIQVLLALLSIFLTAQTALLLCGMWCARLVFAFAVVDGAFLVYPQFILADTLLLFLVTLFFERMARFYVSRQHRFLMQAGFFLGLSLIVKPSAVFLPVGLAVCFFVLSRFVAVSCTWRDFLIFCGSAYVPLLLYVIRNGLAFGHYRLSFLSESGLFFYFNACLLSKSNQISSVQAQDYLMALADTRFTPFEYAYWKGMAVIFYKNLFEHPVACALLWLQNISKTFFGLYTVQLRLLFDPSTRGTVLPFHELSGGLVQQVWNYFVWAFSNPYLGTAMLCEAILNGIRWLLVLCGVWKLWKEHVYELLMFFFCVIGCCSVVTGFYGAGRYRIPLEPLLLILAAEGILCLRKLFMRIKSRPVKN